MRFLGLFYSVLSGWACFNGLAGFFFLFGFFCRLFSSGITNFKFFWDFVKISYQKVPDLLAHRDAKGMVHSLALWFSFCSLSLHISAMLKHNEDCKGTLFFHNTEAHTLSSSILLKLLHIFIDCSTALYQQNKAQVFLGMMNWKCFSLLYQSL